MSSDAALAAWQRAVRALETAHAVAATGYRRGRLALSLRCLLCGDALLFTRGPSFRKHAALEAAVQRDLVRAGAWARELDRAYSALQQLRNTADYGLTVHASGEDVSDALVAARRVLEALAGSVPGFELPLPGDRGAAQKRRA